MRMLQLHEYLALLDGGARTGSIDDAMASKCLQQAAAIWPLLRISDWEDHERQIETVAICQDSGHRLVHISADWPNCFLILVVPPERQEADSYLLFDIGAEYREVRFLCPNFDVDEVAEESIIRRYIAEIDGQRDPFAILEVGDGTYMQTGTRWPLSTM